VIGLSERAPSFAKRYADAAALIKDAVAKYAEEVRKGLFPAKEHYRD
jgi:3-methyl-2-oxobutanoate hydroxymethyltransferase